MKTDRVPLKAQVMILRSAVLTLVAAVERIEDKDYVMETALLLAKRALNYNTQDYTEETKQTIYIVSNDGIADKGTPMWEE